MGMNRKRKEYNRKREGERMKEKGGRKQKDEDASMMTSRKISKDVREVSDSLTPYLSLSRKKWRQRQREREREGKEVSELDAQLK